MIYAFLSRIFVVTIYALFPPFFSLLECMNDVRDKQSNVSPVWVLSSRYNQQWELILNSRSEDRSEIASNIGKQKPDQRTDPRQHQILANRSLIRGQIQEDSIKYWQTEARSRYDWAPQLWLGFNIMTGRKSWFIAAWDLCYTLLYFTIQCGIIPLILVSLSGDALPLLFASF